MEFVLVVVSEKNSYATPHIICLGVCLVTGKDPERDFRISEFFAMVVWWVGMVMVMFLSSEFFCFVVD